MLGASGVEREKEKRGQGDREGEEHLLNHLYVRDRGAWSTRVKRAAMYDGKRLR